MPLVPVRRVIYRNKTDFGMKYIPLQIYQTVNRFSSFLDAPPSFYDMGNAISSLIAQESGGGQGDGEECVLLSEEHSLVLTCCWVSIKVKQMHNTSTFRKMAKP